MSNQFNVSDLVSRGTKQALSGESMLIMTVDKSYKADFVQKKYISGQTITIDIEPQATITEGRVGVPQDYLPKSVSATLGQYNGVFNVNSINKQFDMDGEAGVVKFGRTIGRRLIREIERTGFLHAAKQFTGAVGSPGSSPGSFRTWAEARAKIDDQLAEGKIYGACSPSDMVALADSLKNATNPENEITKLFRKGKVYDMAGIELYQCNSTYRHTAGTADNTTPLVDGAPAEGATTLHIDGTTNGDIVNVATKFTVGTIGSADAVYAVDPETKENLPYLYVFSAAATTAASSGSGDVDITVSEAMYGPGSSRQNMSQLPTDGGTIVFHTEDAEQAQMNMVYAPDALSLISVPPAKDSSGGLKEVFIEMYGVTVRMAIHPRDAINDFEALRCDAIWTWISPRPNHGQIVWGA